MATRKRRRRGVRRAKARRNPINPVNPTRRRRSTRRRGRRSAVYARRRNPVNPVNPSRRRRRFGRRRARRNPVMGSVNRALPIILSSPLIVALNPITAQLVARVAPQVLATPLGLAGTTVLTSWGLSAIMRMIPFTRKWADDMFVAGLILGGGQVIAPYAAQFLGRFGGNGGQGGNGLGRRYYRNGLNGIGVMTGIPPGMPMLPMAPGNNGMQGIGARPGTYAN